MVPPRALLSCLWLLCALRPVSLAALANPAGPEPVNLPIEADLPQALEGGALDSIFGLASRDVRSLVMAVGAVAGQCYWTLVILAVISSATVAWRLAYLRAKGIGGPTQPPSA